MTDKDIIELIDRFEDSDISRLKIRDKDFSLELERDSGEKNTGEKKGSKKADETVSEKLLASDDKFTDKTADLSGKVDGEDTGISVKAPLAGVFYSAPKPGAGDYVKEGQSVKKGETLGLVEAMKMMNEIISPVDGKVRKINVKNEKFVQFNEVLMIIEQSGG